MLEHDLHSGSRSHATPGSLFDGLHVDSPTLDALEAAVAQDLQ